MKQKSYNEHGSANGRFQRYEGSFPFTEFVHFFVSIFGFWMGILGNRLESAAYLNFLQNTMGDLLDHMPLM